MKIYKNVQAIDIAIERILHFISSENLSSGEKLPSERFMSETWGIHRTTLRSALKKL
ncbi:GntR family transcriptional regulator, partial [Vibrio parahaemolyticus]